MNEICKDACDSALSIATVYDHTQTEAWNSSIINSILKSLISESSSTESQPKYKFAVNSTIIQHLSDPRTEGTDGDEVTEGSVSSSKDTGKAGRRGMHSASGAYWNNDKDGMSAYKYEAGESKGMDVVVSVMWIAV